MKTVAASLGIAIYVTCPNEDCACSIDLLAPECTNDVHHDSDGALLRQIFTDDDYRFECHNVVCTMCKTEFHVHWLDR